MQCDVCPRLCKLREGQRGLCFVRARHGDGMVLTTWGRSSGFCIDPVEKKPLNHFLPGTPILSFGTAGCNLTCKFCQNWDISKSREFDTPDRPRHAGGDRRRRRGDRLPQRRLHLQRPGDLPGVRDRRGRSLPRARHQDGGGDGRVHLRRAARRVLPAHGRRQRRPEGLHRGLLPEALHRAPAAGSGYARLPEEGNRRLVRDHHPARFPARTTRTRNWRRRRRGSSKTSGPTCRCTSPPSIPTGRCSTPRRRRPRRSAGRARSR